MRIELKVFKFSGMWFDETEQTIQVAMPSQFYTPREKELIVHGGLTYRVKSVTHDWDRNVLLLEVFQS